MFYQAYIIFNMALKTSNSNQNIKNENLPPTKQVNTQMSISRMMNLLKLRYTRTHFFIFPSPFFSIFYFSIWILLYSTPSAIQQHIKKKQKNNILKTSSIFVYHNKYFLSYLNFQTYAPTENPFLEY